MPSSVESGVWCNIEVREPFTDTFSRQAAPEAQVDIPMSNTLQQINISYVPTEDRLLMKVSVSGDAEYRIWLTRRYTGLLVNVLNDQINREGGFQELASSKATLNSLRGGAFEQPYEPQSRQSYPLGEAGVLGFRINAGKSDAGALNLQLLPEQGEGISVVLDKSMLYMLMNLLEQGLAATDWNLPLPLSINQAVH